MSDIELCPMCDKQEHEHTPECPSLKPGVAEYCAFFSSPPQGWRCPVCGHGVSPYLSLCPCQDKAVVAPGPVLPYRQEKSTAGANYWFLPVQSGGVA